MGAGPEAHAHIPGPLQVESTGGLKAGDWILIALDGGPKVLADFNGYLVSHAVRGRGSTWQEGLGASGARLSLVFVGSGSLQCFEKDRIQPRPTPG